MYMSKILTLRSVLIRFIWKRTYIKKKFISSICNKYQFPCLGIVGFGFFWPTSRNQNEQKEDVSEALKKADNEFDNGRYEDCYQTLKFCKFNDNVEVKWRICRVLYNMAKDLKYNQTYRKNLINQAFEIMEKEVAVSQNNYAVHKWFALILGAKSNYDGYKERIKMLENIKEHMDLAVTLNPHDATTLHMLGEWCYQLTEMPWLQRKTAEFLFSSLPTSSYEDALEYFLRAETEQPRFYSVNLLRLGNCYLKLKKEDQAKYYLHLAASYPAKSNEDHHANKEAAELLKNLK